MEVIHLIFGHPMKQLFVKAIVLIVFLFQYVDVSAYGECSDYGVMATYDSLSHSCECMRGYVMKNSFGGTRCVSGDSACRDELGFGASYDSLSESCECSFGYVLDKDSIGRDQCVSTSTYCSNKLGYGSQYDSLSEKCECRSGYIFEGKKCVDGTMFCHSKHGIYSTYKMFDDTCECDDGYTLDNAGQCVKKQNNVYFDLQELDTDNRQAIIRNNYRYYLVSYGSGCPDSSFERYVNRQIVVNLGTDFDVDTFDEIVLQDHDRTCSIAYVEHADSDTTLQPEEIDDGAENDVEPVSVMHRITPSFSETKMLKQEEVIDAETHSEGDMETRGMYDSLVTNVNSVHDDDTSESVSWYKMIVRAILRLFEL